MKINRLDRVVFMVRDIEKAIDFFSNIFGEMRFKRLSSDLEKNSGVRCALCSETGVQLISPIFPLSENVPSPVKKQFAMLKEHEMFTMAVAFAVDSPDQSADELEEYGIQIQHRYKISHDYISIGMDNFIEFVPNEEDTFGVVMALAKYDSV